MARIVIIMGILAAGMLMGVLCMNRRNSISADNRRIHIVLLSKDIEAGQVIKEDDLNEVAVVPERKSIASVSIGDCIGKKAKFQMNKGTALNTSMLCIDFKEKKGVRKIPYAYIHNTDALKPGDYIDVRISFPNGADFVLLGKKEVLRTETSDEKEAERLWLGLNEEEILRMSSGVVDAYLFEGAYIYAVLYMNSVQEPTLVNYPVNKVVQKIMKKDPNIVNLAQDQKTFELRNEIEQNNDSDLKEGGSQKEEGLAYFN